MTDPQNVATTSYPLPPMQFVNNYTDENIKKGRMPKPPPPVKDSYTMFGVLFHAEDQIIRPLESQSGIKRLHPQSYDPKRELKKFNHSILVNFLDLLDILIKCPDNRKSGETATLTKRNEKLEDLTLLFIHIHHLINEFRPHQARETLRVMLEIQQRQRLETAERFQNHLEKVQEMLQKTLDALPDSSELESTLTLKLEEMEVETNDKISIPSPIPGLIKQEPDPLTNDDQEHNGCNTLDKMMCNIVDAMT